MVSKRDVVMTFENTKSKGCGNSRKHVFSRALLIGFLAVFSFSLYAQDTDNMEFWFVAPDASKAHADRPTFLMVTTGNKAATVTISMPNNKYFKNRTDTIMSMEANSNWKFEFTGVQVDSVENAYTSSGTVTDKGILITSTAPVSAYYQINGGNQKEIFTLKGKKALGNEFYMPFQNVYKNDGGSYQVDAFRQIQIVATEDNTEVTVIPANGNLVDLSDNSVVNSGASKTKTLNKGQTLLWRGQNFDTLLTGTKVTSTNPIAVTLFEDCNKVPNISSIDPIGDQMVPTDKLGQNYIVVKGFSYGGEASDHVGILAVEDGTTIQVGYEGGNLEEKTLNKGEYWSWDLGIGAAPPQAYFVTADQPVYCMHQSAAGSEVGGSLLPSLYSISARRIAFYKGNMNINSMFLVFRESAQAGFKLDGDSLKLDDQSMVISSGSVGFDGWMYAKVDISKTAGEKICIVENDKGAFSLGYFLGSATVSSLYGYFSAFGSFSFESDIIYHCGHSYTFSAPYGKSYEWKFNGETVSHEYTYEATKSGEYTLIVDQEQYLITDETYLKLQNFDHTLSAPEKLLQDKSYNFTIELNPQNDSDNIFTARYEWKFFDNEDTGGTPIATSTDPAVAVSYSTSGTKTILLQIWNEDAFCDTTITRTIEVLDAAEGKILYWRSDAKNNDWNNVHNWSKTYLPEDSIPVVPSSYTKVYLPGKADNYPSLSEENTDWIHYGQPEAKEIVFRYGSELHYQHKLQYEKAYVNYNWGYYGNDGTDGDGQPKNSLEDAEKLKRDSWHIFAAPLKSMASGDFSLAGHPFSWQQRFQVVSNPTGSVVEGDFSKSFPTNDIGLATTNNAIAVKMAGYKNQAGYGQQYLEGLKGVIEVPYFENKEVVSLYPAHNYDALSKRSYFYYFDTKTLRIINSPMGTMTRSGEAYRFVYETDQNELPPNNTYIMPLNTDGVGTTGEVMVGNPLLAPIDAEVFAEANTGKIDVDKGYKLLSEDGSTWEQKFFEEGNTIPAWKAFIVTLQPSASTLSFPLEASALRMAAAPNSTRSSYAAGPAGDALSVQVFKGGTRSGNTAQLQHNRHTDSPNIRKMILPEGHRTPEVFFISSDGKSSNLIQQYRPEEKEVAIGIKTSDVQTRLSLEFGNIATFSASTGASVVLVDKHRNVRQDLTRNPVYPFTQQSSGLDNQYVDRHRFVLQLGGDVGPEAEDDAVNGIDIVYRSGILEVTSDENINTVLVYDLYGRLVFSSPLINLPRYNHPVALQGKMYLVRVKTVSGKEKVRKIMGN